MASFECCHKCVAPKRHPGCHGHCQDYEDAKAVYEAKTNYLKSTDADKVLMVGSVKYNNQTAIFKKKYPSYTKNHKN